MQEGTPTVAPQPTDFRAGRDGPLLTVSGLAKSYRRRPVLRDVSLHARPGQVLAITGENGSGKTTLLRTCAGVRVTHWVPGQHGADQVIELHRRDLGG